MLNLVMREESEEERSKRDRQKRRAQSASLTKPDQNTHVQENPYFNDFVNSSQNNFKSLNLSKKDESKMSTMEKLILKK